MMHTINIFFIKLILEHKGKEIAGTIFRKITLYFHEKNADLIRYLCLYKFNMRFKNVLFVFLLLTVFSAVNNSCFSQSSNSGHLIIKGLVYGYNYDPSKKLLKKDKQIKVEGVLENVSIDILENGQSIKKTETNANGAFQTKIKTGKIYTLEFSKTGYSSLLLTVDLTSLPKDVAEKGISFNGAELILNSFSAKNTSEKNLPFGKLYFNNNGKFLDFEAAKVSSRKLRDYNSNPSSMMTRSVQKNRNSVQPAETNNHKKDKTKSNSKSKEITAESSPETSFSDTITKLFTEFSLKTNSGAEDLNDQEIEFYENNFKNARIQLEEDKLKAKTSKDSLILREREHLLNSMERELNAAKKLIALQNSEITTQRQLLILTITCVLLLLILLLILSRFTKQKKKTYLLLKEKNKKITDSINYAYRIQESILPSDPEIKKQLPQSFIFFQPRDKVSGDFYWLSVIDKKIIIACVDCTGHGVPGAFMSLIGNTLLNEIINEKKIITPSLILKNLHVEIVKALHQNTDRAQSKDGMDMSLCVIDNEKKEIEFCGAMNPLYIVKENIVSVIKADMKGIGGDSTETEFTDQVIPIEENMTIYMFTDGYMDQFGGPQNKKFNIQNFKKLLLEIQHLDMPGQEKAIEKRLQDWQGNQKQIDDILVMGIRF
jgi:serine phosphatase RsbU (regulator of sigma subunit)